MRERVGEEHQPVRPSVRVPVLTLRLRRWGWRGLTAVSAISSRYWRQPSNNF